MLGLGEQLEGEQQKYFGLYQVQCNEEQDSAEEWKKVALAILCGLREEGLRAEVALVNDPTQVSRNSQMQVF